MKNEFIMSDISLDKFLEILQPNDIIEIYTDGSCKGNPGAGGWGAILLFKNNRVILSGNELSTTNNRMELTAAIQAINTLPDYVRIVIYTDSSYVKNGITVWLKSWKLNNWKTADNKPVKNIDLWKKLDDVAQNKNISWNWVKGHSDCENNNNADFIAKSAISEIENSFISKNEIQG